ncbi:MAG: RNA methyltransferase [Burkholderiaceae bacterium]
MNLSSDFPQKIQQRVHALANIRMVLVRTSHPGNVGQVARAMANMGLRELVITSPRFPDMCAQPEAIALASGATDVLAQAQIVPDLATALQGVNCAYAFSARPRDLSPPLRTAGEAAAEVMASLDAAFAQGETAPKIAFVFGAERSGLVNDEVMMCQRLCQIEANPAYNSLNLAQAVQVMSYSLRQAALHEQNAGEAQSGTYVLSTPKMSAEVPVQQQPADVDKVEGMLAHWEQMLVALELLNPQIPSETLMRLRAMFARTQLTNNEVNFLRGIARAVLARHEPSAGE